MWQFRLKIITLDYFNELDAKFTYTSNAWIKGSHEMPKKLAAVYKQLNQRVKCRTQKTREHKPNNIRTRSSIMQSGYYPETKTFSLSD